METLLSITQLAEQTGATPRAIRLYESKGLLSPRRAGTTRVYGPKESARMKLILRGKKLGFSLDEIREYLDLYDADPNQVAQIEHLLERVRTRIRTLEEQRKELKACIGELRDIEFQAAVALEERSKKRA